jgi:hypothetical protein
MRELGELPVNTKRIAQLMASLVALSFVIVSCSDVTDPVGQERPGGPEASRSDSTIVGNPDVIVFLSPDSDHVVVDRVVRTAMTNDHTACVEILDPDERIESLAEDGASLEELGAAADDVGWAVKISLDFGVDGKRRVQLAKQLAGKFEGMVGVHRVFLSAKGILPEQLVKPRCT